MDKTSLMLGWLAGRRIAGQMTKSKTPIAYLYNGVPFPALPEWDKTVYPYAVIFGNAEKATLYVSTSPWWADTDTSKYRSVDITNGGTISGFAKCYEPENETPWEHVATLDSVTRDYMSVSFDNTGISDYFVWTNTDIYDSPNGGALYLSASDPVPVYDIVGYTYNGVTAKDINEVWTDKETYKYAFLARVGTSDEICLFLTTSPCYARYKDGNLKGFYVDEESAYMEYKRDYGDFSWNFNGASTYNAGQAITTTHPFWTSEDLKRANHLGWSDEIGDYAYEITEEIALSASDPIPVYA